MFETRAPGAKFATIGDNAAGDIVEVRRTQQTEYKTNIPLYWENKLTVKNSVNPATGQPNDPKLQYEITVETHTQDENGVTERRIFVRGKRMEQALRAAVGAGGGGREGLLIGGWLSCTLTGTEPSQGGGQDAKLYTFKYRPPAAGEGRRPDMTPVLYGGEPAGAPQVSFSPPPQPPVPSFNLRAPAHTGAPIATPYPSGYRNVGEVQDALAGKPAPAAFTDEPPF